MVQNCVDISSESHTVLLLTEALIRQTWPKINASRTVVPKNEYPTLNVRGIPLFAWYCSVLNKIIFLFYRYDLRAAIRHEIEMCFCVMSYSIGNCKLLRNGTCCCKIRYNVIMGIGTILQTNG